MRQHTMSRRAVLRTSAAVGGLTVVGGAATASASSTESEDGRHRIDGTDRGGSPIGFDLVEYVDGGAVIESVTAYESPMIADLHTVLWDSEWKLATNTRDDAIGADVSVGDAIPETTATVEWKYTNPDYALVRYWPEITQRAIVSAARPALLVERDLELGAYAPPRYAASPDLRHTVYSIANPTIGEERNEGWVTDDGDYDVFVATDHEYSVAIVQRYVHPAVGTSFDGHRVGDVGVEEGENRSAWFDIYEEADGWIDRTDASAGEIDFGAGLSLESGDYDGSDTPDPTWRTGIGFGTSDGEAVDNAIATVEDGYETERDRY